MARPYKVFLFGARETKISANVGEPDEIANAIVFLASDKASLTTGQALSVGGGKSGGSR